MLDARKRRRRARRRAAARSDNHAAYDTAPDPQKEALVADAVGAALLVVLETLQPAERLAFVLHDLFTGVRSRTSRSSSTIAARGARRWVARARRRVPGARRHAPTADRAGSRRCVLVRRPQRRLRGTARGARPRRRPPRRRRQRRAADRRGRAHGGEPREFSAPGARRTRRSSTARPALSATEDGVQVAVLAFTVVDGRIAAINALSGPARIAGLGLEAFVAADWRTRRSSRSNRSADLHERQVSDVLVPQEARALIAHPPARARPSRAARSRRRSPWVTSPGTEQAGEERASASISRANSAPFTSVGTTMFQHSAVLQSVSR